MPRRLKNEGKVEANSCRNYLYDLGRLLLERALEAKKEREDAREKQESDFHAGKLLAYNEVISLVQQQALAFQLPLEFLGLDKINPDKHLV